jgi:hypothetical protein
MPSAIVKITHNLLWFNIEGNIDTLEDQKKKYRKKSLTYSYRKLRTASPYISSPFAKKKRSGEWDHDDRNNIVQEGINPTMMTEPCRSFFKDIVTPIVNCLEKHLQNDVLLFINKHSRNGQMPHSKFRKICSEKGNSCTTN